MPKEVPDIYVGHIEGARDKFREKIRARDNYTCQNCFRVWKPGKRRFDVHHLDEKMDGKSRIKGILKYDKANADKLITLCHRCHFGLDRTRERIAKGKAVNNSLA